MDQEILEYLDESKINEDVSYSCDFASAIQACIVDLKQPFNSFGKGTTKESRSGIRFAVC